MTQMPHDTHFDSTLSLLNDPYRYVSKQSDTYGSDMFRARLLLQDTICMTGTEAAELFYNESHFIRKGAMPGRIQQTLLGVDGVQGLDDEAHKHRKQLFMSLLMNPTDVQGLTGIAEQYWRIYVHRWAYMDRIVLYDEVCEILTRAVCEWAGVPLAEEEVKRRTKELKALFDYAGSVGPKHWWARLARWRATRWAQKLIEQVRADHMIAPEESALRAWALHRDLNGNLLDTHVAATELLNILRPTVAVAVFVTFVAHALHQYPEACQKVAANEDDYVTYFVQEVRRVYPFFPVVAARVRDDFQYKGCPFHKGTRVLLDLYGTNHNAGPWQDPDVFRPERFQEWDGDLFNFIPQGGGNAFNTHRCPGENVAIELMKSAALFLARDLTYTLPEQNLQIDYKRLPALPKSHIILTDVQPHR